MNSLRRNSIYLLLARLTAQGLALLFVALLARRLDIDSFGQFAFIAAVVLIANTVTNFGTDTYLIREIARAGKPTGLIAQTLSLQLAISAVWILATFLLVPNSPLLLYSLSLFPLALSSVSNASLRAFERMDLVWILSLFNGLVQLLAAWLAADLWSLCLDLLIGQLLVAALAYRICSASLPRFSLFPLDDFSSLFKQTLPFAALTILIVLSQRLGVLMVTALEGDSSTGIFSSVTRVVDGLKLGHYAILGALLPVISRRTDESKQSFRKGFILLTGLSLLMAGGLALFPRLIILILYGEKFVTAIPLLALLGWSLIPYTVSSFFSYDLIARGRETSLVKATAVSLVIFLGLYLWLISLYQLNGAIYAALVGEIMQATILVIARSGALAPRRSNLLPPHGDSFLKTRTDLPSLMTSDSDPILTPSALLAYRRANGQLTGFPAPRAVIFAPQKSLADYILRLHPTKRIEGFLGEFHLLKRASGQIALSSGFGIGAPVIAGLADEFAALGVKQFVSIGMAGGLQPELTTGSLVIARRAIRGEGVSRHYLPPDETVESDSDLVQGIGHILTRQDHPHHLGTTWTTDAPFRELRKDVLEHQKQGVLAVDMEAAAMMAVARSHDLSAVAIFSIADQLSGGEWRMADDLRPAQKGLSVLFDAVYEHLSQR